jgi:hypothetical protein
VNHALNKWHKRLAGGDAVRPKTYAWLCLLRPRKFKGKEAALPLHFSTQTSRFPFANLFVHRFQRLMRQHGCGELAAQKI